MLFRSLPPAPHSSGPRCHQAPVATWTVEGWDGVWGNEATYQGEDHHNGILMGFNRILWNFDGILMGFNGIYDGYPLVNCYITMENHHVEWENSLFQWPFSIANC